MLANVIKKTTH